MLTKNCRKFIAAACLLIFIVGGALGQTAKKRPNILLIISDDLNTAFSLYGHPPAATPNIERLARRGVMFENAYAQFPLCNPSRTSFLSGLRPEHTKTFDNRTTPKQNLPNRTFLPEFFEQNGYYTIRVGKVAHNRAGYENEIHWNISETQQWFPVGQRPAGEIPLTISPEEEKAPKILPPDIEIEYEATDLPDEAEPDNRTARRVVQLFEQKPFGDKPFFFAVGFLLPHVPYITPRSFFDLYPFEKVQIPFAPKADRADIPPVALTDYPEYNALSNEEKRKRIQAVYAAITFMDKQVGIVLDALEKSGEADNTIIVFTSDHGLHLGEHNGLWAKNTLFREATRIPLIVSLPKRKIGKVSKRMVELVDLYPTLADLAGLKVPNDLDGVSFAPLLEKPNRKWKLAAYSEVARGGRSVMTERYRYTEWNGGKDAELYDWRHDVREFVNLANDPKYARVRAQMKVLLDKNWSEENEKKQ